MKFTVKSIPMIHQPSLKKKEKKKEKKNIKMNENWVASLPTRRKGY